MAVMIAPAAWRSIRLVDFPPLDEAHLVERLGAFTIIVCGEAFVKVAIAVSNSKIDGIDVVALTFQFILTFALWASYFEDIPFAGIDQQRFAPWISFHLVMQLGIAGTAIGVSKLVATRLLRAPPGRGHPRDHGHALHGLRRPRRDRRSPRAADRVGRCCSCASAPRWSSRVIGLVAWKVPWFELLEGVAMLTVAALVHAYLVARLRSRTEADPGEPADAL